MEKFTIVTQGSATYLERTLGADELLDEVDRGMLVSNQISGMLPLNIQWINADCRLLYNITGLTPLVQAARILEHETRLSNFLQFGKPLTETSDVLGDGCCTEKENEADELSYQQDKELIPSLAVGSVDAAAEDVEHQRSNHIAGQG